VFVPNWPFIHEVISCAQLVEVPGSAWKQVLK